jgi:competence protein ComEC
VPGLVLGNTDSVSETLAEAMRITSLTHLMAVSGSNCAIVVGIAFGIAALCGAGIVGRVIASAVALALFVALVGPEPSVIRAALMSAIGLGALVWGRPVAGVSALSAAVILALAIDPSLSHSLGMTLSVAATLGLLVIARPLAGLLERWMPKTVALVIAIPVSASVACQPILLVLSPFVPTYGIAANLVAEPLVPFATVAGLLSIVTTPIPALSDGLLWFATAVAGIVAAISRGFASLPGARLPWPPGWVGIALAMTVSAGVVLILTPARRRIGLTAIAGATALGLGLAVGANRLAWASAPRDWSWAQCDVGQGDAVVLRSAGRVALIDTGRTEPPLRDCLATLGVTRIDLLVLTHFDIDHAGGYGVVVGMVDEVLHGPTDGPADEYTLSRLSASGARLTLAVRGMTGSLGDMAWRVLWPSPTSPRKPGNPSSVTVDFRPGPGCHRTCVSGLTLGDLPGAEQASMLASGGVGVTDLVKVSHHGSRDQDPELYRRVRAAIGLIGVGADNEYGHPTAETLDVLAGVGTTVLRSDINGIVLVWRTEDGMLRVWRERGS